VLVGVGVGVLVAVGVDVGVAVAVAVAVGVLVGVGVSVGAGITEKVRVSLRLIPPGQMTCTHQDHGVSASAGRYWVVV